MYVDVVTGQKMGKLSNIFPLAKSLPGGENKEDPIIEGVKPVLFVGKLLGVLPAVDIISSRNYSRGSKLVYIFPLWMTFTFFTNWILQSTADIRNGHLSPSAFDNLHKLKIPGFAFAMFFAYIYILYNFKTLGSLLRKISSLQIRPLRKSRFSKFGLFSLLFIFSYGVVESLFYEARNLSEYGSSYLDKYYMKVMYPWHPILPKTAFWSLLFMIIGKLGTYAWMYGDILVIVICRGLTEKLKDLQEDIVRGLEGTEPDAGVTSSWIKFDERKSHRVSWDVVREKFTILSDLIEDAGKYVSPLVLSCYGMNVYLIVINLFHWIAPNTASTPEQTIYSYFAFAYFSFRVSSVTYFVGDVYHVGSGIVKTLQNSPTSSYNLSLERLERSMLWSPCGISLFGTFMITRKFFVSIISFVVTTEIVLLQAANGSANIGN